MTTLTLSKTYSFETTQIGGCTVDGQAWLPLTEIAKALGYKDVDKLRQLYQRNKDEFNGTLPESSS